MQECYYQIEKTVNGYELLELVSDTDTLGRKISGKIFKKVFENGHERCSFVSRVESELSNLLSFKSSERRDDVFEEIYGNCKETDNIYGYFTDETI